MSCLLLAANLTIAARFSEDRIEHVGGEIEPAAAKIAVVWAEFGARSTRRASSDAALWRRVVISIEGLQKTQPKSATSGYRGIAT
jgi:hypothetical protein